MRLGKKTILSGLALALLLSGGTSQAATDLNEMAPFLVYPAVVAIGPGQQPPTSGIGSFETYLAVVNAGPDLISAHIVYVNGQEFLDSDDEENPEYCYECNYNIPLTPNDTELITIRYTTFGVQIDTEDDTLQGACPHPYGFVTINAEDPLGDPITDNVLLGSEVVINYGQGWAFSIPAIPFQGSNGGNGDRTFIFDDATEYGAFPSVIAADFIAPEAVTQTDTGNDIRGFLVLFTLGFETEFVPRVNCEIEGYDAAENPFSRSFNFGCWTFRSLTELHTEFAYGNLGQQSCMLGEDCDTHGWFYLDCSVRQATFAGLSSEVVNGGVHGAIIQIMNSGQTVRRNDPNAPPLTGAVAWARLLYQSNTTGGAVTFQPAGPSGGLN
jgi:hypothetical protein